MLKIKEEKKGVKKKRHRRTKAEIEAAKVETTEVPKKRKRRTKAEIDADNLIPVDTNGDTEVLLFDLESLTTTKLKKAGIGIKTRKVEFAILADTTAKALEFKLNLIGNNNHSTDIADFNKKKFDIVLTPDLFNTMLEYLKETPKDKLEKRLRKLKTAVQKSEKDSADI